MTENQARTQLRQMLRTLTVGSVLHLLADLFRESADHARRADDATTAERHANAAATLFVVGLGIDAACPR